MAKGSLKLNMKKDDPRTLMLKMDARLTYAGRDRRSGFKLEGERKIKHIEVTHQLINAEFNRAKKDILRRFDFYQTLKEQNKERRQKRDLAWCEEEEKEWEQQAMAEKRRRRLLPKLRVHRNLKAEAGGTVGSIRRDVKGEFANKMAHEMHLNRSLIALTDAYSKHKILTQKNKAKLGQIIEDIDREGSTDRAEVSKLSSVLERGQPEFELPLPKARLPELKLGKEGESSVQNEVDPQLRAGKAGKIPTNDKSKDQSVADIGPPSGLGRRSFYMNTSNTKKLQGIDSNQKDPPPMRNINHTRRKGVYKMDFADPSGPGNAFGRHGRELPPLDHPSVKTKKPRPYLAPYPQQMLPLRFYGTEENPFLKGDGPPVAAINRARDLVDADKADEMYEWLGFESREELEKLRAAGLLFEQEREEGSETSSVTKEGTGPAKLGTEDNPD
ncbi:uncharacterized protein LOC110979267 [Acanthaster planci]|uniref:Uncharacterized protein LOC110979267 n=1 Tax=Acanthaster planci TaxID=133434 RepID=A0A8B7YDF4_ACAPL|nr:uncharacterized protein LOC110979267 [Acanthaster planci]XP_022090593.1 uncharacterized protein LOC110979267 [Acanthaster planci]